MRKQIFIVALLITGFNFSQAQDTKRVVNYSKNGDKETYYVLQSDNNVMYGSYEKKTSFGRVEGEYKNGLKEGMWTEYSKGSRLRSRGTYLNNERVGLWTFYNWGGELEQEYNFSTKELVSDILLDGMKERKFKVIKGTDTTLAF